MSVYFSGITFQDKSYFLNFNGITFSTHNSVFFNGITFGILDGDYRIEKKSYTFNNKLLSKNNKILINPISVYD